MQFMQPVVYVFSIVVVMCYLVHNMETVNCLHVR